MFGLVGGEVVEVDEVEAVGRLGLPTRARGPWGTSICDRNLLADGMRAS